MALTPEQRNILSQIKRIGRQRGATPKEIKAAVETGLVESNLTNPSGGDADSAGWRQERRSLYKNPTDVAASINRFFDETAAVRGKYARAGDLAAAVQRPAAQYRGRYQAAAARADQLLGASVGASSGLSTSTRTIPGVDRSQARRAAIAQFLGSKNADPVDFALQIKGLQDTPARTVTTTRTSKGGSSPTVSVGRVQARADAISRQRLPYQWGGGHGNTGPGQPLDCSGAVSKVLGISPRVASQFETFGLPGRAPGGKGVTIYAKDTHVLVEINGRLWGTSASNPGGGAGWIPRSAISPAYLKGFVARHVA